MVFVQMISLLTLWTAVLCDMYREYVYCTTLGGEYGHRSRYLSLGVREVTGSMPVFTTKCGFRSGLTHSVN